MKTFKTPYRPRPTPVPTAGNAEETPVPKDEELETPEPITPQMLEQQDNEKTLSVEEDEPCDVNVEDKKDTLISSSMKHRELMENRLRRMKRQSLSVKKMHYGHVMDLPG